MTDTSPSHDKAKIPIKAKCKKKWEKEHSGHHKNDAYYQLSREEKVKIFRLRTCHSRLRCHMFNRSKTGTTDERICGTN